MKILVINPGSTSTKIAVYENETPLLVRNIKHTVEELSVYPQVIDQFEFRKNLVLQELEANGIPFAFDAVIGRGGLVKPIPGGVYAVNEAMKQDTLHAMRTDVYKRQTSGIPDRYPVCMDVLQDCQPHPLHTDAYTE